MSTVHPDLEGCSFALKTVLATVSAADAHQSEGGKWSVAQVLEHLDLTYTKSAAGLVRRIQKGPMPARSRTMWQIFARFVVVRLGHFPTGRRAPESVLPQGRPFSEIAPVLERHLVELDERLSEAERLFGDKVPILDHPIIGPFSVSDWRRFHLVHTRHHVKQLATRNQQLTTSAE